MSYCLAQNYLYLEPKYVVRITRIIESPGRTREFLQMGSMFVIRKWPYFCHAGYLMGVWGIDEFQINRADRLGISGSG